MIPLDESTDGAALCREHPGLAVIGGISRRALEGDRVGIEREVRRKGALLFAHGRAIPSADAHYPISDAVSFDNMRFYLDLLGEVGASS